MNRDNELPYLVTRIPVSRRRFLQGLSATAVYPEPVIGTLFKINSQQNQPEDLQAQIERDFGVKLGVLRQRDSGPQHELCRNPNLTPCVDIPAEFGDDRLRLLRQSLELVNPRLYSPIKTIKAEIPLTILLANISASPRAARTEGPYEMYLKYTQLDSGYPLAKVVPAHELIHLNDEAEIVPSTSSTPEELRSPWYDQVYEAVGGRYNLPPKELYLPASSASNEIKQQYPLGIANYYDQMEPEDFYRKFFLERFSYAVSERFPREFVAVMGEQNIIFGDALFEEVLGEVLPAKAVQKIVRLTRDDILQKAYPRPLYELAA